VAASQNAGSHIHLLKLVADIFIPLVLWIGARFWGDGGGGSTVAGSLGSLDCAQT
jgi:hypothetical protein